MAACVRPGRIFISRLLMWLRQINSENSDSVLIPHEVKKDLDWWDRFLYQYNGISIMLYDDWSNPDEIFSTDACLMGIGGIFEGNYFHRTLPEFILDKKWNICVLELLAIIVAMRLWSLKFKGKCIIVHCDNESVCQVINTGRTRCPLLQEGLRELCFLAAVAQCQIKSVHLAGSENRIADCLSRWDQHESFRSEFERIVSGKEIKEWSVMDSDFNFVNNW